MSLGELFIELGVVGNIKPLQDAIKNMKEAVKLVDDEVKANQRLISYLQDVSSLKEKIKKAQKQGDVKTQTNLKTRLKLTKENYAKEFKQAKALKELREKESKLESKKELAKNLAKNFKQISLFIGTVTTAAYAVNRLVQGLVSSNQEMLNLTRTSDIAVGSFQKWSNLGQLLGIQNAEQQIASLNERLFELRLTGQGAKGFLLAGINPMGTDAEGVMEQLRSRVQGMSDTSASYLLREMGIDPNMLHLLRMTRKEFDRLNGLLKDYRLEEDQVEDIKEYNQELQIASIRLRYFKDRIVLGIMPAFTTLITSITNLLDNALQRIPRESVVKDFTAEEAEKLQNDPEAKKRLEEGLKIYDSVFDSSNYQKSREERLKDNRSFKDRFLEHPRDIAKGAIVLGTVLTQLPRLFLPSSTTNNATNNQINTITQHNTIYTTETAKAVDNSLIHARESAANL